MGNSKKSSSFKLSMVAIFSLLLSLVPQTHALATPIAPQIPNVELCDSPNAILGSSNDDTILGTAGDDIICTFDGNDQINGLEGDDIIFSGSGDDEVSGGVGSDFLSGDSGNDTVNGNDGDDNLWGGDGLDELSGGIDDDYISGGNGADNLWGGLGLDSLLAGSGDDGLDGGLGLDYVDGESGSNTCVKDVVDTTKKCFFDNQGPKIQSIAVDPATAELDSTIVSKTVKIRVLASDPGAGIAHIYLSFSPKQDLVRQTTDGTYGVEPCSQRLVAGNINRGVFELSCEITQHTLKTSFVVQQITMVDVVGNSRDLSYLDLAKRKLAVSFKQIGNPDTVKPMVRGLKIINSPVVGAIQGSLVYEFEYSDFSGSGVSGVSITYKSDGYPWTDTIGLAIPPWSFPTCTSQLDLSPCTVGNQDGFTKVHYPVSMDAAQTSTLGKFVGMGRATATKIVVSDNAGNKLIMTKIPTQTIVDTAFEKQFVNDVPASVSDGDKTAPEIKSFSLDRTSINTSTGEEVVTATIRATDHGIGFTPRPGQPYITQFRVLLENFTFDQNIRLITRSVKSTSGRPNDLTVVIEIRIPAHFPRCNMNIVLTVADASKKKNSTTWSTSFLKKSKLPYRIINGG